MKEVKMNHQDIIHHLGNTKVGTWLGGGIGVAVNYLFPEHGILASSLFLQVIALVWPIIRTLVFAGLGGIGGYYGSLVAKNAHLYFLEWKTKNKKNDKDTVDSN
jgi:hypothetical protein